MLVVFIVVIAVFAVRCDDGRHLNRDQFSDGDGAKYVDEGDEFGRAAARRGVGKDDGGEVEGGVSTYSYH